MKSILPHFILLLLIVHLGFACPNVYAQSISVKNFALAEKDMIAMDMPVLDQNGNKCTLIRVQTTQKGFVFDVGSLGVRKVDDKKVGEVWVYVPAGVKHVDIRHATLGSLIGYGFPVAIASARTYIKELTSDEIQTVVKKAVTAQYVMFQLDPKNAVAGYSPTSSRSSWPFSYGLGDNYPAYYISYEDVKSFITKLNQMTGQKFRMPTEAEWEYAAKGGKHSKGYTYSGSNTIDDVAWYTVNSYDKGSSSPDYGTHPVKTKSPNELGIYDMSGNVWEWCSDWYGSYGSGAVTDPTGATSGSSRVDRGGSWGGDATYCRSAYRCYITPSFRGNDLGFRLAL